MRTPGRREDAAAERGVSLAALVAKDPWSLKRVGRLERGLKRDGEHHRAPVADLEREKLTREFGLTFAQDPRTGRWDVVGVPNTLKKTFSRRQAQIRERAIAAGHRPHQVVAAALEGREPGEPTAGRGPGPDGPRPIDPDAVAAAVWDPEHERAERMQREAAQRAAERNAPGLEL